MAGEHTITLFSPLPQHSYNSPNLPGLLPKSSQGSLGPTVLLTALPCQIWVNLSFIVLWQCITCGMFSLIDKHWCGAPPGQRKYASWQKTSLPSMCRSTLVHWSLQPIITFCRLLMSAWSMRRKKSKFILLCLILWWKAGIKWTSSRLWASQCLVCSCLDIVVKGWTRRFSSFFFLFCNNSVEYVHCFSQFHVHACLSAYWFWCISTLKQLWKRALCLGS